MANKASAEKIAADIRPPDFRKAVQSVRGDIKKKKDRLSSINGEIADVWAKIEGMKVNKKGAKLFMQLDNMDQDERNDVMRSLNGLIDAAEWPEEERDLVDNAQGTALSMRVGGGPEDDAEDEEGEEDEGDESSEGPAKSKEDGLARARSHLRAVPDAMDEGSVVH